MNVTVAEEHKLKRRLSVEVPLEEVSATYQSVYDRLKKNIQVKGFRPGKFPRHLAEKRFKDVMASEALQTLVPRYYQEALEELKLQPGTEPAFENLEIDQRQPLRFDVAFEVVPEFELLPPSSFVLTEEPITVDDAAVDERVEELRKQRAGLEDKGDEPAEPGDVVTFDFEATRDGETFEGGSGQEQKLEVDSDQYLPDFNAQFRGAKAGEHKSFDLTFPEDYGGADLAGQTVQFQVDVKKVERRKLPELESEFFAQFGEFDDEAAFREDIRRRIREERERTQRQEWQEKLAEQIREQYEFDVPETLTEEMVHQWEHELEHNDPDGLLEDEAKLAERKAEQEESIRKNLRLNYVIDRYAKDYGLQADPEEVRQRFFMQAYMMQQNPQQLVNSEYGQRMLYSIEQSLLATRVLDHLANTVLGKPNEAPPEAETATDAAGDTAAEAEEADAGEQAAAGSEAAGGESAGQ